MTNSNLNRSINPLRNYKFQLLLLLSMTSSQSLHAYRDEDDFTFWAKAALAGGAMVFGAYKLGEAINERSLLNSIDNLEKNKNTSDQISKSMHLYSPIDYAAEDAAIANYVFDAPGYNSFVRDVSSKCDSLSRIQNELEGVIRSWKNSDDSRAGRLVSDSRDFSGINADRLARLKKLYSYYSGRKLLVELAAALQEESKSLLYGIASEAKYATRDSGYRLQSVVREAFYDSQFPFLQAYRKLDSKIQNLTRLVNALQSEYIQTSISSNYIYQAVSLINDYRNTRALISSMHEYTQDMRAEAEHIRREQELENQRRLLQAEKARLEAERERVRVEERRARQEAERLRLEADRQRDADERELSRLKRELASMNDRIAHGESYLYPQKYRIEDSIRALESKIFGRSVTEFIRIFTN